MANNSLPELLLRMKDRSIAFGWAAILFLSRKELNRLLEEQYQDYLSYSGYLQALSVPATQVSPDVGETVELQSLVFGAPVLSFERSSLTSPTVTATMDILAGKLIGVDYPTFGAPILNCVHSITQEMGYKISFEVSLLEVFGSVDYDGRIKLEIADQPQAVCNLGETPAARLKVAELIMAYMARQGSDWGHIEIGRINKSGNYPLSPTRFDIRTMQSPSIDERPGDGAVVIFMHARALQTANSTPIENSGFEYCLPEDPLTGESMFSAAVLINHDLLPMVEETQLDTLKSMFFPAQNVFVEPEGGERHTPHDLLVLGHIARSKTAIRISPSSINLAAGKTQEFIARDGEGRKVDVAWTASVPGNALAAGPITPTGLYTVPPKAEGYAQQQLTVVTARYNVQGVEYVQSARVIAQFQSMMIKPQVCVRPVVGSANTVELAASTLSAGGALDWPALPPEQGTLVVIDNNHAVYTPPPTITDLVERVNIVVTDPVTREQVISVIVLYRVEVLLPTQPNFLPTMVPGAPVRIDVRDYTPDELNWTVVGGGPPDEVGHVDNGVFTPPTNPSSSVAVVQCTARALGLSIFVLEEEARVPVSWRALDMFQLITPNNHTEAWANGIGQIQVVVEIKTQLVELPGGVFIEIPVSDLELSSLRFVNKYTGGLVPILENNLEGIEFGQMQVAVNRKRNRYRYFSAAPTGLPQAEPVLPTPLDNRTRYAVWYFNLAEAGSLTFFAQFQDKTGRWWKSSDIETGTKEVTLTAYPHTPDVKNYRFEINRVYASEGRDFKESTLYPNGDNMSGYPWSVDFWKLDYLREGRRVGFVTAFIQENISTIQYEDELIDERMMTYTGFALTPAERPNVPNTPPTRISFDAWLWAMFWHIGAGELKPSFDKAGPPAAGQVYITMHRADDVPYWYDDLAEGNPLLMFRKRLDPGVRLVLTDEEGNRHVCGIDFGPPTSEDSRNFLYITKR